MLVQEAEKSASKEPANWFTRFLRRLRGQDVFPHARADDLTFARGKIVFTLSHLSMTFKCTKCDTHNAVSGTDLQFVVCRACGADWRIGRTLSLSPATTTDVVRHFSKEREVGQ